VAHARAQERSEIERIKGDGCGHEDLSGGRASGKRNCGAGARLRDHGVAAAV
jgi:hypothetical protein